MFRCTALIAVGLITVATAFADEHAQYIQEYFTTARPVHIVLGGPFEYRYTSSFLGFRPAAGPADQPFQPLAVNGPIRRVLGNADQLYIWVDGDRVLRFPVGPNGPEGTGIPTAGDWPVIDAQEIPRSPIRGLKASGARNVVINPQRLFVANSGSTASAFRVAPDTISVIDTTNGSTEHVALNAGDGPRDVVLLPDNSKAITANYGCATCTGRGLSVIDPVRLAVTGRYTPSANPSRLAVSRDGNRIYAADGPEILVFMANGSLEGRVPVGIAVRDMAVAPDNTLYAVASSTDTAEDKVVVVAPNALAPRATWVLPANSRCASIAVAGDGRRIYVGCLASPMIYVIDTATGNRVTQFAAPAAFSIVVSPDGRELYVARADANALAVLDAANGTRLRQIQTRGPGAGLAINFDTEQAWMSLPLQDVVTVIDLNYNLTGADVAVGPMPLYMSFTQPQAVVTPASLEFVAVDQATPPAQTVTLRVTGATPENTVFAARTTTERGGDWLRVTPIGGSTFPATLSISVNPAGLLGTLTGTVLVNVTGEVNAAIRIPATLRVVPAGSISLSASELTFTVGRGGTAAPQPIQVTTTGGAPIGWVANTSSLPPWLSLPSSSGVGPGELTVSVLPQGLAPGRYQATVQVTAMDAGLSSHSFRVILNVLPEPSVPQNGIVNAASFAERAALAPGSLISIFGTNFGVAASVSATTLPLPTMLGNVSVTIGGRAIPLVFVSSTQINAQIPYELAGQSTASLVVTSANSSSSPVTIALAASNPGLFTLALSGRTQGAVLNTDGRLNTVQNPARTGEVIQIFGTGQGLVTNSPPSGAAAVASPLSQTPSTPVVTIGGLPAEVTFSGLAPGFAGLWQINGRIPAGVVSGNNVPLQVQYGPSASNTVVIAVSQ